jgi:hypothetical protein
VDDSPHVIDVDPASRDIGRNERGGCAGRERAKVAVAGVLGQVAMQLHRSNAGGYERAGEDTSPPLGPGEHDRPARCRGQITKHRHPLLLVQVDMVLRQRLDMGNGIGVCHDRIAKIPSHEHFDRRVQGRREQHALTLMRSLIEQAPNDR